MFLKELVIFFFLLSCELSWGKHQLLRTPGKSVSCGKGIQWNLLLSDTVDSKVDIIEHS